MGEGVCRKAAILTDLFGGEEHFLVIDYNYTVRCFGSGS